MHSIVRFIHSMVIAIKHWPVILSGPSMLIVNEKHVLMLHSFQLVQHDSAVETHVRAFINSQVTNTLNWPKDIHLCGRETARLKSAYGLPRMSLGELPVFLFVRFTRRK